MGFGAFREGFIPPGLLKIRGGRFYPLSVTWKWTCWGFPKRKVVFQIRSSVSMILLEGESPGYEQKTRDPLVDIRIRWGVYVHQSLFKCPVARGNKGHLFFFGLVEFKGNPSQQKGEKKKGKKTGGIHWATGASMIGSGGFHYPPRHPPPPTPPGLPPPDSPPHPTHPHGRSSRALRTAISWGGFSFQGFKSKPRSGRSSALRPESAVWLRDGRAIIRIGDRLVVW